MTVHYGPELSRRCRHLLHQKSLGGTGSRTPVDGIGIELPSEAAVLKFKDICQIGEDLKITCQVLRKEQEESCLQEL